MSNKQAGKGFFGLVYEIVSRIPEGKVATYGQVARLTGNPRMARQVGWALHVNKQPVVIPCHRVINKSGGLCSGYAFGGRDIQRQLLEKEGVAVDGDYCIDLEKFLWQPQLIQAGEERL